MPTPVTAARQCLTQDAASVLDHALSLANRRGHAQTTSLHMVSSLLSLPRSPLREACTRTRNNAYSARVQFKALELSLTVSLDRLPSSQGTKVEEPPVSNSLMAAIKRSQANQRRQPENFTFYQQQYASGSSSIPVVKVELQNLILSILDDPLVSRVFAEAGFRSYDIKLAMLRPGNSLHAHHLFGYSSRYRRPVPPLFLCNLNGTDSSNTEVGGGKGFNFPFMGCFSGDENSRRIGDIMVRGNKRSPLLLGVSAADALKSFLEVVQRKISGVLPEALNGLSMVCINDNILRYLNGDYDKWSLDLRLDEVQRMVENFTGPGVVLSLGDLNALAGDGVTIEGLNYLVGKLSKLLEMHRRKLWLISTAATHEVYSKILGKCPNIEEDWDLEILPITSQKFSMGGTYPRSSLMGSFVPLGGFFPMPYETQSPLSNTGPIARCHLCNEKCEQEIAALSNGGLCDSVAEQYQSSLPSWLQSAEPSGQSSTKGIDDSVLLNARITGIQKKWESICQKHHFNQSFAKGFSHQIGHQLSQAQSSLVEEKKREASNNCSNHSNESSNELGCKNALSSLSNDLRLSSSQRCLSSSGARSKANNQSISSKSAEIPSDARNDPVSPKPHRFNSSSVCINDGSTSSAPVTSVTTDLGLGIASVSTGLVADKSVHQSSLNRVQHLSCALSSNRDTFTHRVSNSWPQPSWFSGSNHMHSDVNDPKTLYRALIERVGRQGDAIDSIVRAMTLCQTKNNGIWINCQGPDRLGKRKLGLALAEILYGSKDSLIYVDLSFQDEMTPTDTTFNSQLKNKYKLTMRGTVVDYLVEKLSRKPSLVFLENIDKADMVVQNTLSQAVKTGRLTDLRGCQVTTSNCIFLVTTRFADGSEEIYNEEDIVRARGSSIQMLIRFDLNDGPTSEDARQSDCTLMNKRKLFGQNINTERYGSVEETKRAHKAPQSYLDLNMPAEGSEICSPFSGESDSDSSSGNNSMTWMEDFNQQIDQIVVLNPFDFQTLSDKLFKDMTKCVRTTVVSECSIEIEPKVMQQLLAAAYLYGHKRVEEWIQQVLGQCFAEAMEKFNLNGSSIVKLVSCEGSASEEQCEGLLPGRIVMK